MIPRGLHVHMAGGLAQPCPVDGCSWTAAGLDPPDGESTSAALRRVEQERDELAHRLVEARADHGMTKVLLAAAERERDAAYALVEQIPGRQPIDVLREVIAAGQDARIELENTRAKLRRVAEYVKALGELSCPHTITEGDTDV